MPHLSAANLHTAIRAAMLELFHRSLDTLTPAERQAIGWAADTADRMGEDVRSAVEECWRSLEVCRLAKLGDG